jgi:hypothetical protein
MRDKTFGINKEELIELIEKVLNRNKRLSLGYT